MSASNNDGSQVGGTSDMVSRMRRVIPASWFPLTASGGAATVTPVLDGLLQGIGWGWSYCYTFILFIIDQARLATATGSSLDMFCSDFFGVSIGRKSSETDGAFRNRMRVNLLRPCATRTAVENAVIGILGRSPLILEPFNAADTGGYGESSGIEAGGGYGTSLLYGSSRIPFQYLMTVPYGVSYARRESAASLIDENGMLQIAQRHVPRTNFFADGTSSLLTEARGINLIKDSVGWSRWAPSTAGGTCRWTIDAMSVGALWAGYPVLTITIYSGGTINGPSVSASAGQGAVTGSMWIKIPAGHRFSSLIVKISDATENIMVENSADLKLVDQWQRVGATIPVSDSVLGLVTMQIEGQSDGLMDLPLLTQCWQLEEGTNTTSYIPSGDQIGIREADCLVTAFSEPVESVDLSVLLDEVKRAGPAGSVAWISTTS